MLTEKEIQILGIFNRNHLVRKEELTKLLRADGINDGTAVIGQLAEKGYVKILETIGNPCFTITQSGMRVLKQSTI